MHTIRRFRRPFLSAIRIAAASWARTLRAPPGERYRIMESCHQGVCTAESDLTCAFRIVNPCCYYVQSSGEPVSAPEGIYVFFKPRQFVSAFAANN